MIGGMWLGLLACAEPEDPCAELPSGRKIEGTWDEYASAQAAAAFEDGTCSFEPPARAVTMDGCEYEPAVERHGAARVEARRWHSLDRDDPTPAKAEDTFSVYAFVYTDLEFPMLDDCDVLEDERLTAARASGGWTIAAWPAAGTDDFGDGGGWLTGDTRLAPGGGFAYNEVAYSNRSDGYTWLCLDAFPPVQGLEDGPAEWRGSVFGHVEWNGGRKRADVFVHFSHADCVAAENAEQYFMSDGDNCTTLDADGIDNDMDGKIDEFDDFAGYGEPSCED